MLKRARSRIAADDDDERFPYEIDSRSHRERDVDLEVHLVRHGSAHTPLPGVQTVKKRCSAVVRGVSHEDRLIGGGARDQEPDGDIGRRDRFGPSDRRNTLRPVSLLYCIEM